MGFQHSSHGLRLPRNHKNFEISYRSNLQNRLPWSAKERPVSFTVPSNKSSYPSTTSSMVNVLTGDLALVTRLGALGEPPRFGDVLGLLPAGAGLPPFFFC